MEHFADRLLAAIEEAGSPACVGIDPVIERLPEELRTEPGGRDPAGGEADAADEAIQSGAGAAALQRAAEAIEAFGRGVVEAVRGIVPAVKPQVACFERYGSAGFEAYEHVVSAARAAGLVVIGDVKRSDIGTSAAHYAAGHLTAAGAPDAVTVSGYLGDDGLTPFVAAAREAGKGVFILVRTSNPSAGRVQDVADADGRKLFEHVADVVAVLGDGEGLIGERGYSCVGAVVGATYPDEAGALRERMPRQLFLVPGYGAQGGTAEDCRAAFKADGIGAIVNASRSVIYPPGAGGDWRGAIREAAQAFAADVARAAKAERRNPSDE